MNVSSLSQVSRKVGVLGEDEELMCVSTLLEKVVFGTQNSGSAIPIQVLTGSRHLAPYNAGMLPS